MLNLRLLTLNIAHGRGLSLYQGFHSLKYIYRNLDRIAHLLRRLRPDVVLCRRLTKDRIGINTLIFLIISRRTPPILTLFWVSTTAGKAPSNWPTGTLSYPTTRFIRQKRCLLGTKHWARRAIFSPKSKLKARFCQSSICTWISARAEFGPNRSSGSYSIWILSPGV